MMEAMHINSEPHALLSDDTTQDGAKTSGERNTRQRAASDAGFSSGPVTAKYSHNHTRSRPHHCHSHLTSSPTSSSAIAFLPFPSRPIASLAAPAAAQSQNLQVSSSASASLRALPITSPSTSSSYPAHSPHTSRSDSHLGVAPFTGAAASLSTLRASHSHLFFGPGPKTTPETSLVGASGEYISVDGSTAAYRTSALRELNNTFPSPVFRHRHTKSAGAQSTTFSQPVIVRTYTGPSRSPSSSTHYRRPSSSYRAGSRTAGSRRIPLVSHPLPTTSSPRDLAANSSKNEPSGGWGLTNSLFGMARSKVKKGSFLPWSWAASQDSQAQAGEAKLPPLEAFTFKGFMADLQTSTDIRSDLDRIAEICARSHYSLSNQYDSHLAPHGSGAGFVNPGVQQHGRSKARRKGTASPGGPTLQAVPSDDDEGVSRGHRRRRGGLGGGRRRSAAYGTLETIMSSSRSSEEDKTKKKPAAEIVEKVRGRAAQKAMNAGTDSTSGATASSDVDRTPGSSKLAADRKGPDFRGGEPDPEDILQGSTLPGKNRGKGKDTRQPKSTSFARAVMGSSRQQERYATRSESDPKATTDVITAASAVPALLGEPALPHTTDGSIGVYSVSDTVNPPSTSHGRPPPNRPFTKNDVHVVHVDGEEDENLPLSLFSEDAAAAGFLSGLTHWIPWVAGNGGPGTNPWISQQAQPRGSEPAAVPISGPSYAEGSLRELLRTIEANKQSKGKAIDDSDH